VATDPAVLSVNVGAPAVLREGRKPTGIGKVPVDAIDVADPGPRRRGPSGEGFSGVGGDFIGSGRYHGGAAQAVYAFAREELDHWEAELGREIAPGLFGENLTTVGVDVDAAEQGDTWRVGTAVLRVSAPRVPCANFAFRMRERAWVRRFAERGRGGCYLAVEQAGRIVPGDAVLVERSGSGLSIPLLLAAWMGDLESVQRAMGHETLDAESRRHFTRLLAKRA
jgi:MOSC domain-containing protein YiiM